MFYTIIIYPITIIIEFIYTFSQKIFKETGISVIAISAAISILCLPLYAVAEKWQQIERNTQKHLKPKIDKIKAIFKGDEQYMILSTYYRQNHYHPVYVLRSTFGLLIQIPFFIAAYSYLSHLEALKGVPFLFIHNLGTPDNLIHIGPFALNILPIVMTLINITAAVVYLRGFPLKEKLQLYGMAVIFLVLLYNSPAGLVLYWTLNNIFSLLKNCYYKITFKHKNKVAFLFISIVCFFMIYYMRFIHTGDSRQRMLIMLFAAAVGIIPWLLPFCRRLPVKLFIHTQYVYYKKNMLILFLSSFAVLWVLTGLYIPSTLIGSSPQEFSYIDNYTTPLFFIYNTALQTFGVFVIWPFCLYVLFSGKIKTALTYLGLVLGSAALCNTFFYKGNYGIISINLQFVSNISNPPSLEFQNIVVLCCILLIIYIAFIFFGRTRQIILPIPFFCFTALLGLSCFNLNTINREFNRVQEFQAGSQGGISSIEPLFKLSKTGKNIVIIMLDRASSSFFPYILEESPDLNELYSGFVYYPNTVSFNGYTRLGAPPIFGGYEYSPEEMDKRNTVSVVDKHNEALLLLPKIFSDAGYFVTVTDPTYPNYSYANDLRMYSEYPNVNAYITDQAYTNYWLKEHDIHLPLTGDILKRNIFWYSVFRISPPIIRRGIYQYGDWCAPVSGQNLRSLLNGYAVLDYLPELCSITNETENTALIMVSNATHEGALLQAPEYRPSLTIAGYGSGPFNKITEYHINIAAYKRLADWFSVLKDNKVYDNTRIILVSDHGSQISYVTKAKSGMPQNFDNLHPILLVKDFNAAGNLKLDMTFMTNADVPSIALQGLFDNPVNPFTGNRITTEAKEKPLYIAVSGTIHLENPQGKQFNLNPKEDYYVHDNIFDPNNWKRVK